MKKAVIGLSGICANTGIDFIENLELWVSIACSVIICLVTVIATIVSMVKSKSPKEIEIKPEDVKKVETEIVNTVHNIKDIVESKKGGGK